MSLRDFDPAGLAARKETVLAAVAATQAAHPRATVTCTLEDNYRNIADSLGNDRICLDLLERGFADLSIPRRVIPLRGGTDGSALSMRGIPTPNYFTGGLNFHSRFEFLPVPAFILTYRLTERLCRLAAQANG
jgi:tripeptide aminopeptidase